MICLRSFNYTEVIHQV